MNRRTLIKQLFSIGGAMIVAPVLSSCSFGKDAERLLKTSTQIAFVKTKDRITGVNQAIDLLKPASLKGKNLFIKPNFNSADAAPGSTHNDTLSAIIRKLQQAGAKGLTIGDRSGMGKTREVMQSKGIFKLGKELGFETIVFDELKKEEWELFNLPNSHWQRGFALPRPVLKADGIIQTCCLKTHRYGGHFTLSLKNSVGLAAKYIPGDSYNYMSELHGSEHQRRMIAEVNAAYKPDLIVLDGIEAFTSGGPDTGSKVNSEVVLAGTDRVAIDAVGVAILRHFGTTPEVSKGKIFEQEQIARAIELNIGIKEPKQIELITNDPESAAYAETIRKILNEN